jgi:hypothetical protein
MNFGSVARFRFEGDKGRRYGNENVAREVVTCANRLLRNVVDCILCIIDHACSIRNEKYLLRTRGCMPVMITWKCLELNCGTSLMLFPPEIGRANKLRLCNGN